jgi:hypothetical protein
MSRSRSDYERGYNNGYQAARRGSRPRPRYSSRVHDRLLDVHSRRWEEMHAHRLAHGPDDTYQRLRGRMIDAARAVGRYVDQTKGVRTAGTGRR